MLSYIHEFQVLTCKSLQEERRLARQVDEMVAIERSRWDSFDESSPAPPSGKVTFIKIKCQSDPYGRVKVIFLRHKRC